MFSQDVSNIHSVNFVLMLKKLFICWFYWIRKFMIMYGMGRTHWHSIVFGSMVF